MGKDFDKFVGFATENILRNWGRLVAENIKNDLEGKEPPKEIPMIDALENLGIELTLEEEEYFKDKVLTYVDIIPDVPFTDMTDHKITVTVNNLKYNSEEE